MIQFLALALFLPLIGFLLLLTFADRLNRGVISAIGCGVIGIAFACFALLTVGYLTEKMAPFALHLFSWIPVTGIDAQFELWIDPLSLLMTLIITGVGFLIHLYSIGYMEHDEDYARYFACMNLFVFAMLLLVLASNLALLFVGWEGVGLASYLLIGYWHQRPSAAAAATKAFVVNRVGDLGFLVALLMLFYLFGTSDITAVTAQAQSRFSVGSDVMTWLTLLLFIGAVGKSAQLPLHVWLPDAMEGPTPVSALIHAATMVTAGVYLLVRMHVLFLLAPMTMTIVGIIGGATALFAALCAIGQTDLKRVLAYSTVSQLGYMFLACGVGAFYAAMFHLTMHAFMKALLFLSAGNVVHMLHDTTEMEKMGGLAPVFPKTQRLFFIGVLAMSGIPPLAAFFSKDLILEQEYATGHHILYWMGLFTAILTAFYLTRAYCLTFTGASHVDPALAKKAKEARSIMIWPVAILGVLSIIGGFLGFHFGDSVPPLQYFLEQADVSLAHQEPANIWASPKTWFSIIGAIIGIGAAAILYTRFIHRVDVPRLTLFKKGFFIDDLYDKVFVNPFKALARSIAQFIDPKIMDGMLHSIGRTTQGVAYLLQRMQSGQIRSYVAWMVIGLVLVVGYMAIK